MPIEHVKLSAPKYDSDKDLPPFTEWESQFFNFVYYQNGGPALIELICHLLGKSNTSFLASTAIPSFLPSGAVFTDEDIARHHSSFVGSMHKRPPPPSYEAAQDSDEEIEPPPTTRIEHVSQLLEAEFDLDVNLYNVLCQVVSGRYRMVIGQVQKASFIQAWLLISHEHGASNVKRRTDLLNTIMGLRYKGNVEQFKQEGHALINRIYDSHVSVEDVCMFAILSAIPDELAALKVLSTEKMESTQKTSADVHAFLDTVGTTLEVSGFSGQRAEAFLGLNSSASTIECIRCGRSGHARQDCYATKHKNGEPLPEHTRAQKGQPKKKSSPKTKTRGKLESGTPIKQNEASNTDEFGNSDLEQVPCPKMAAFKEALRNMQTALDNL